MTENKRFHFGYVCGDTGLIDEQAELKWFIENVCNINDLKKNWLTVCDKLNEVAEENEQLKKENKHLRCTIESNSQDDYINYLKKQNEQLKQELFEARKDYLIETADISDKLYLEDEIEEERKEIFGDNNDQMKGMWND